MASENAEQSKSKKARWRVWVRRFFLGWAAFVFLFLWNSMRTQGVPPSMLADSDAVRVRSTDESLQLQIVEDQRLPGLIFICGSGVEAEAYTPMLRDIAEVGYPVHIVRLPWRFGPLESHKQTAVDRTMHLIRADPDRPWIVAGHSLGGALVAQIMRDYDTEIDGAVLVGTTHPKQDDLSTVQIPVTKVYGTNDGVAPAAKVLRNRKLLPPGTEFVELDGGNHSQFGHYGHQLMDRTATMPREQQQSQTRAAILEMLSQVRP